MQAIIVTSVDEAVKMLIPYLEDTSRDAHKSIYFDGWSGLAASAVLRAIAENPGESLRKKFDRIIHVDCSRWKNRRQLQRAIADQLKLPQHVMDLFDRQDEEDDFSGVEESSRAEIADIKREIYRTFMDLTCLLILNNGSDYTVDIASFGFPLNDWYNLRDNRLLWTFRGRLRLNPKIDQNVDRSHLSFLPYEYYRFHYSIEMWKDFLAREAKEITQYSGELHLDGTKAAECCLYLLSLNYRGGDIMDYNWATHASNYWVCDGIITVQGEEEDGSLHKDQAWELAAALHQEIRLEDYSSNTVPSFAALLDTPKNRWVLVTQKSNMKTKPTLDTTSLFIAFKNAVLLPYDMFHQANKLRVLRLCNCTFSFSSPPFHCCHNLRFLGLDKCQDHRPQEAREDNSNTSPALEIFQRLWVLDICYTDWELAFPTESTKEQQMVMNIREVHINNGRIWHSNFAWRRLKNLQKLRVIEPTHPWGMTGEMDEFADSLKTLILEGCVGLEKVGPRGLPSSLESFSFDSRAVKNCDETKLIYVSLAGCLRLESFTLRGPLPNLKELDLSNTRIKSLDLKDQVVQVPRLRRVILLGCKQLRAVLWPEEGVPELMVLSIDILGVQVVGKASHDSLVPKEQEGYCHSYVAAMDMRFLQLLLLRNGEWFCCNESKFNLNLRLSSAIDDSGKYYSKKKSDYCGPGILVESPLHRATIPVTQGCYKDVNLAMVSAIDFDISSAPRHEPLDIHVEIGEGISYANVVSEQALSAVSFVMNKAESLHVHDNFSITSINAKRVITWPCLKWCHIERCHKLNPVFYTDYIFECFTTLEAFSASELMMANCIWSRGRTGNDWGDYSSFAKLRSIHLHYCPRLTFVLPLSWATSYPHLPSLETLHIVYCSELRQVFPVEPVALSKQPRGALEFPKLKHIHLRDVPKLQQICKTRRMVAPQLDTISVRGCWALKRIPAIGCGRRCPIVDCEKEWWEKLEWDGLDVGHHPSLFEPRHSRYYKKDLPRGSLLQFTDGSTKASLAMMVH
uniref:Disease resistance protein At4g27190-like leucine-rich repeats domain-containing protein n=1 Tax=Oryza punctata TaxID=4537 RepID=A0A0E0KMP2_ORYPU